VCDVSECDREASIIMTPWPTKAVVPWRGWGVGNIPNTSVECHRHINVLTDVVQRGNYLLPATSGEPRSSLHHKQTVQLKLHVHTMKDHARNRH
jgi:hypothetical protein